MSRKKEIEFHYDDKSFPIAATCIMCGEKMPKSTVEIKTAGDMVLWFAEQFQIHKRQNHSREEVNKATARIVREATDR